MSSLGNGNTIFMTGASGNIGSTITQFAIADGYKVRGLTRSDSGAETLKALGATPVHGDLQSLDTIRNESANADFVIHLADTTLQQPDYEKVIQTDGAVVDAIAEGIKGTDKPLLTASGTLMVAPDPSGGETNEESPPDPNPLVGRIRSEQHALSLTKKGVKVICIRLAPYVYGRGTSGIRLFMSMSYQNKQVVYVDDGHWPTSTVHVDDAARLYLLAMKQGKAGETFNCTNNTQVTQRQLAEAMAAALKIPAVSVPMDEAQAKFGPFLSKFLAAENRGSSAKARNAFGWQPREVDILEEINHGSYQKVAKDLMEGAQ